MPPVKTKGINIRSVKVGEADKIITIFSRELGKISAIAKGARKLTSKFGGRLEVFSYNDYLLASGKSLYIVSQVETIESFWPLREQEKTLKTAGYIARLLNAATEPEHKIPALFDLTILSLHLLKEGADAEVVRKVFEVRLMEIEGFFPNISGCVKCKKKVTREPKEAAFNLILGGLTCSACSKIVSGGIVVPYKLVKFVQEMKTAGLENIKNATIDPKDIEGLDLVLKPYISEHIGKDIRNW